MANKGSGLDPRELALAPKSSNGVAGKDVSTAVQDAIIAGMVEEQENLLKAPKVADLFGEPSFRLPDREGVYANDRRPGVVSRKMAQVTIPVGGLLVLETTIYAEERVVKDQSGSFTEQVYSVSLPRGLAAPKEDPTVQRGLSLWKQSILDKYDTWITTLDASMPVNQRASNGPRLVKRVAIAEPAPKS